MSEPAPAVFWFGAHGLICGWYSRVRLLAYDTATQTLTVTDGSVQGDVPLANVHPLDQKLLAKYLESLTQE